MRAFSLPLLISLGVLVFLLFNSFFVVDEREQAIVFQFGESKAAHLTPGLKFKIPLVQNVQYYPSQALSIRPQTQRVVLDDKKILMVDSFAYYRIADPLRFFQNLKTEEQAERNIGDRINSTIKEVLGQYTQSDVLSPKRAMIMEQIRRELNGKISTLGVRLTDVRIGRADLPEQTSEAVFQRMITERQREANQLRAEGQERAKQIEAMADREKVVLLAEAERDAQTLRGEGDAQAITIYAEAFNADPEFFRFYRSLEAYRKSLSDRDSTTLLLSPDSPFFEYFGKQRP
jgi:modulator of FtsH protease HflC